MPQQEQTIRPKAKFVREGYPLRIIACFIVLGIHLSLFHSTLSLLPWSFVLIQTLIYPHIAYYLSTQRKHEEYNIQIDAFFFGGYITFWGFSPLSTTLFFWGVSLVSLAVGGKNLLVKCMAMMAIGITVMALSNGLYYRETLPTLATLISSFGLICFGGSLGFSFHKINTHLRKVQQNLSKQKDQLIESNELAQAINAELDLDKVMEQVIATLRRLYSVEHTYITLFDKTHENLKIIRSYGDSLTPLEKAQFNDFTFSIKTDCDSIFVSPLLKNKSLYLKKLNATTIAKTGAAIDQRLYNIKPSKSILYLPLSIENEVVGGLGFINYEAPIQIGSDDIDRMTGYLLQVGTAIRNAKLFEDAKQASDIAIVAQQAAEASEAAKSHFLANMSHEIRTPMTAIIGYSESLRDEELSKEEQHQFVETIIRSGKHLLTIINDILDLSKIEAHKLEVEHLKIPLANLIKDLHAHISIKAEEKGLAFDISPILPLPSFFMSDPTRIKQILFNLASNAVKFTHQGTINILIRYEEESDTLYFEVKDTGIGLTTEQKNKVFEPFVQADNTTTRKYGGTGLGLYISKQLADILKGEIYADSQPGLGSEFVLAIHPGNLSEASWFKTPEALHQEIKRISEALEKTDVIPLEGNILVAEDNPENQRLLSHLFSIIGLKVTMVDNGKKALEVADSCAFDLVLLDIQMPVMGGEEAASLLKQQHSDLPLIALTANVMQHQIDNYLKIGFTDIIGKPFERKHFYQTLKKYLPEKELPIKGRVLIAEDNPVNLKLLTRQVEKISKNISVTSVVNGAQALKEVYKNAFDLILMDMEMPVMNGLDALKVLRSKGDNTPVYMVTGNINPEAVRDCLKGGANGHIEKPIDTEQLNIACIKHLPA